MGEGAIGAPDPSGGAFEPAAVRDERTIEQHGQELASRGALFRGFAHHLRNDQAKPPVEYRAQ
jgi:hypothetical protein